MLCRDCFPELSCPEQRSDTFFGGTPATQQRRCIERKRYPFDDVDWHWSACDGPIVRFMGRCCGRCGVHDALLLNETKGRSSLRIAFIGAGSGIAFLVGAFDDIINSAASPSSPLPPPHSPPIPSPPPPPPIPPIPFMHPLLPPPTPSVAPHPPPPVPPDQRRAPCPKVNRQI